LELCRKIPNSPYSRTHEKGKKTISKIMVGKQLRFRREDISPSL